MNGKRYCWLLAALIPLWSGCGGSSSAPRKYNIILLAVDTLRADHLGCYGYEHPTSPRIDAFAKKALRFEYAFCPIPKTSASFASMLTGLHPCIHRTKPFHGPLKRRFLTLAEMLQARGYRTAAVVDNANLSRAFHFDQGFASYTEVWNEVEDKSRSTAFITEKVLSFLEAPHDKPFLLWVNYIEPHVPYVPPQRLIPSRPAGRDVRAIKKSIVSRRSREQMQRANRYDEGYCIARYDGAVSYIDEQVGRILDAFYRKGLDRNTVFIFLADHGEDLGERNFFFEHGTLTFTDSVRIPMIVHLPGRGPGTVRTPVSIMDIYPTVVDLLKLEPPHPFQGVSLLAPRKGRLLYILGLNTHAVVQDRFHYIKVSTMVAAKLGLALHHYHDLLADPRETRNLHAGREDDARALAARYDAYLEQHRYFRAPLLRKPRVKLPEKDKKSLETLGYL